MEKNNASKIILDNITANEKDKLYLKNSFKTSVEQLEKKIINNNYDLIISFGECPLDLNTIRLESTGRSEVEEINSNYNFKLLKDKLKCNGYKVIMSDDAGNYLCNNIYYNGLKIIRDNKLRCNMIFIHIPTIDKIEDIEKLATILTL